MRHLLTTALLVATGSILVATGTPRAAEANAAGQYFSCNSGFTFQRVGHYVRCYKAGPSSTIAPSCQPLYSLVQNVNGTRDRCRNAGGGHLDYSCPPTFPPEFRSGQDMCVNKGAPSIVAPNTPVTI